MEVKNFDSEIIDNSVSKEAYDENGRKRILSIRDLEVQFQVRGRHLTAIRGVNLDIYDGEAIAIVGESGSGKSVLTKTFSGMLDSNGSISNGSITYYDETLSDTKAYDLSANERMFNYFLNALNRYSKFEAGASIYNEMMSLRETIATEKGVSKEFIEENTKKINDLKFDWTELFNQKQTLNSHDEEDKKKIEEINAKMVSLKEEIKNAEAAFKLQANAAKTAYVNDTDRVNADNAKMAELKEAYAKAIDVEATDEQILRNKFIARDLVMSVARYPLPSRIRVMNGILGCFKQAMKKGIKIDDEEVLNNLFTRYAFRVKYLAKVTYPTDKDGKVDKELLDYFYQVNDYVRFSGHEDLYKQIKDYENRLFEIGVKDDPEYVDVSKKLEDTKVEYGKYGDLYHFTDTDIESSCFAAYKIKSSLVDKTPEEKKELLPKIMEKLESLIKGGTKISDIDFEKNVFEGICAYREPQNVEEHPFFPHNNGRRCKQYWFGTCRNSLEKFKLNKDWQLIRGARVATIFQDPMTSLNPIITIGKQITDCILKHQDLTLAEAEAKALELLKLVGIPNPEKRFNDYPFQYSGGMRQRIVIAIALSCEPKILICDEPTTALDVTIQAQIIRLIKDLQKKLGFTIVFITHDLGVVANVADRVAVLYAGQIVEVGNVEEVFYDPRHPYTWALLSSLPQLSTRGEELFSITGTPPSLYNKIKGDPFAPRNPYRMAIDYVEAPPMFKITDTHYAKTWLLDPRAPHAEKPAIIKNIHEKLSHSVYSNENSLVDEEAEEKKEIAEEAANEALAEEAKDVEMDMTPSEVAEANETPAEKSAEVLEAAAIENETPAEKEEIAKEAEASEVAEATTEETAEVAEASKEAAEPASNGKEVLLSVKNIDITFGKGKKAFKAVKNASFDIYKGETFSLVGESGSGKTTIGRAIIRINPVSAGEIDFKGKKISGKISHAEDREVVRNIQMVFQDPAASLNERATIEYIIGEGIDNFHLYKDQKERMEKIQNIVKEVGLLPEHLTRYPHEFSGGQRQRVGLARSIIMHPQLVIADEPISALDVSIRAQVLNLLKKFQRDYDITYLFVAHDLSIVRFISDRIAVIYKGTIVEIAESEELFNFPLHPYTKSLLSAIPVPDPQIEKNKKLYIYDPSMHDYETDKPSMREIANGHMVFCNDKEFAEYKKIRG